MDKTPIQVLLNYIDTMPFNWTREHSDIVNVIQRELLPYEKQFADEMFNAGYKRGEDQTNVINLLEGQVFPDFKTLYSKYEK